MPSVDIGTAEEGAFVAIFAEFVGKLQWLSADTKYAMGVVWAASLIAFGALFVEFGVKLQWVSSETKYAMGVVLAAALIAFWSAFC